MRKGAVKRKTKETDVEIEIDLDGAGRDRHQDAVAGPSVAMLRAWILIHSGSRAEEGYRELERLLGAFGVIPRFVSVDPLWRLLKNDARVQRTIQAKLPR